MTCYPFSIEQIQTKLVIPVCAVPPQYDIYTASTSVYRLALTTHATADLISLYKSLRYDCIVL